MARHFIPAAHFHALTPFYEFLAAPFLGGIWRSTVRHVVERAPFGVRILDVGCGPGTILRYLNSVRPDLVLWGLDIDRSILQVAKRAHPATIQYVRASGDQLPFPDRAFDVVTSTLTFHHLSESDKLIAMREIRRVMTPSGTFLLCDFSLVSDAFWTKVLGYLEPGIRPQLRGELFQLVEHLHGTVEIVERFYASICIHVIRFPSA